MKWLTKVAAVVVAVHVSVVVLTAGATPPHGALGKGWGVRVVTEPTPTTQVVVAPAPPVTVVVA